MTPAPEPALAGAATPSGAAAIAATERHVSGRRPRTRSERSLIDGALAGSEPDLEELFRRHWSGAYRTAFLIVHDHAGAEDIAQEAFVAAIRRLDSFDRRRPLAPWLSAIVANRAIDWVRARASRHETGHEVPETASGPEPRPTGFSAELVAALATLSPEHRAVVVLRHVVGYTPGEIARLLDLPRGTINSRLRRGLDAVQRSLGEEQR